MKPTEIRVDFSLRREVFFVVIGGIVGAITMVLPKTIFEIGMGLPYYLTWMAFGHIVGVYSPPSASIFAGIIIHLVTAISIGTVAGIFLYKTGLLNINKILHGLYYGLFTGTVIFIVFFIPVQQFVLAPEIASTLVEQEPSFGSEAQAAQMMASNLFFIMIGSIVMHLVFGITLGLFSSLLSVKFGARYRCTKCGISFSRIDSHQKHTQLVHGTKPIKLTRILILGGGFAGIEVLRELQDAFQNDVSIDITLVSQENFFLFTPMLPEISSGIIETRHIATPVRVFCKRAKFYEATVKAINLQDKQVVITHAIGRETNSQGSYSHTLEYDYLVLALGAEVNFFGMADVEKSAFTIKSLGDAILIRNHVINMLEQAELEHENDGLRKSLLTFVIVGGGFAGVETVGELNDFVRESIKNFYHNMETEDRSRESGTRIILVNSGNRLLPEVSEDLAESVLRHLQKNGVEILLNTRVKGATANTVELDNGIIIPCYTLIWTGGVTPTSLIEKLPCDHDKGRIVVNNFLEVKGYPGVFALGDCTSLIDPNTGRPYPPTAQHAIREAKVLATNIISEIRSTKAKKIYEKLAFCYKTKGVMAIVGKRHGVGILFGHKIHGFVAWWIWRSYYLANLPTTEKKFRVLVDWTVDIFFKRDVTRVKTFMEEKSLSTTLKKAEVML